MNPRGSRYYTYIRPIIRSKFARTYSSLIFSLITIFIFSFYAIRPTVTTIISLQKSMNEQREVLAKLQEKVNNLSTGKRNYESIEPGVKAKLKSLVPDEPALAALVNSLSQAVQISESSMSGLQFEPIELENQKSQLTKDAPLSEINFTLNSQASFANQMKLLTILKRLDRLVTIKSINFSQPDEGELIMTTMGKAYYIKN